MTLTKVASHMTSHCQTVRELSLKAFRKPINFCGSDDGDQNAARHLCLAYAEI